MEEKFTFDVVGSLNAIRKILYIAEQYKHRNDWMGELASRLIDLKIEAHGENYINYLNNNLITCRSFKGLDIERVWDGGVKDSSEKQDIHIIQRLALFLIIYEREIIFRNNQIVDQGSNFYFLDQIVRHQRDKFEEESYWCLELLDDMPTYIMQEEFHSEHALALSQAMRSTDISKVEDFINTKEETISKIDTWNSEFNDKEQSVIRLKNKLSEYETAFNFVGLYQGFSSLLKKKVDELDNLQIQYFFIGLMIVAIPILELAWVFENLNNIDPKKILFIIFPTVTLLVVLFWFFRIILQNLKSVKSQIMQLELRMTLCQFIQSYSEKSKELKEHNKEGFEKFENLIFSSIVSSDEKIPSTFDGMEHVSNLLKNFKSNS